MKSDKKRPGREKSNRDKFNKDKFIKEKADVEKADVEKADVEKADMEKADAEKVGKEEHGSAEAAVDRHDGSEGEKSAPEGSSVKADNAAEADSTAEADTTAPAGSVEPDDREDDEDDWEKDDGSQDDWEEESEPSKPWVVALVFLGMVFAAGCICVMLWIFTHPDRQEEGNQNVFAGTDPVPGNGDALSPSQTALSGTGDNQGDNATDAPGSGETDAPEHVSNLNRITTQEGRVIIFRDCDDVVTPKEYVNLRTEPSTSQGDATVGCSLSKGETAHRTGISDEMGWSRVEYNDQVLYVVTSLVSVVTDSQTAE